MLLRVTMTVAGEGDESASRVSVVGGVFSLWICWSEWFARLAGGGGRAFVDVVAEVYGAVGQGV